AGLGVGDHFDGRADGGAAGRTHPRPGLPGQRTVRRGGAAAGPHRPGGGGVHPRRRVRRRRRRPGGAVGGRGGGGRRPHLGSGGGLGRVRPTGGQSARSATVADRGPGRGRAGYRTSDHAGGGMNRPAIPVSARATVVLGLASLAGLVAFCWPLFVAPEPSMTGQAPTAPMVFMLILPLVVAVVLAELAAGRMDAKVLAMLGVL